MSEAWGKIDKINVTTYSVSNSFTKNMSSAAGQLYDDVVYSDLPEEFSMSTHDDNSDDVILSGVMLEGQKEMSEIYLKILGEEIEYWQNELDNYDWDKRLKSFEGTDVASEFHLVPCSALYGDQAGGVLTPELVAMDVWSVANGYLVYPGDTYLVDDIKLNKEYWEDALDAWCMKYYGQTFLEYMTINKYLSGNVSMLSNAGSDFSNVNLEQYTMDDFIAEIASSGSGFNANSMSNSNSDFYSIYNDGYADEFLDFLGKCYLQTYTSKYNQSLIKIEECKNQNQQQMDYLNKINQELASKEYLRYSVIQYRKELDFVQENIDIDEYNKYVSTLSSDDVNKIILNVVNYDEYDVFLEYLPEEDIKRICYLYENAGKDKACEYVKVIEDKVNNAKGLKETDEFAASIEKYGYVDSGFIDSFITANSGFFDGAKSFEEGLFNWFNKEGIKSANDYAMMYKILYLQEKGYLKDVYNVSSSIGNMAVPMIVSASLSALNPSVGSVVGNTLMGASAGGNAYNNALISGNDRNSAYVYGVLTCLSETAVGELIGNIPGLNSTAEFSLKGILREGFEEGIQTYVDAGIRCVILGEPIDVSNLTDEALQSVLYGMITSGVLNGGKLAADSYNVLNSGGINVSNFNDLVECYYILNNLDIVIETEGDRRVIHMPDGATDSDVQNIKQIFPDASIQLANDNVNIDNIIGVEFLDDTQKQILREQIQRYNQLSTKSRELNVPKLDVNGKVIFEEGTLIHGIGKYNDSVINGIAENGIVSGQTIGIEEDGETFFCADFFRVSSEISVEKYQTEKPINVGGMTIQNNSDRFTPFPNRLSSSKNIAFIVTPSATNSELLSYDCYRNGTDASSITKGFVNEAGLPFTGSEALEAASILYGVPSNSISGIVVGDAILQDPSAINNLKLKFPNCYIVDSEGNLVYNPSDFL